MNFSSKLQTQAVSTSSRRLSDPALGKFSFLKRQEEMFRSVKCRKKPRSGESR